MVWLKGTIEVLHRFCVAIVLLSRVSGVSCFLRLSLHWIVLLLIPMVCVLLRFVLVSLPHSHSIPVFPYNLNPCNSLYSLVPKFTTRWFPCWSTLLRPWKRVRTAAAAPISWQLGRRCGCPPSTCPWGPGLGSWLRSGPDRSLLHPRWPLRHGGWICPVPGRYMMCSTHHSWSLVWVTHVSLLL